MVGLECQDESLALSKNHWRVSTGKAQIQFMFSHTHRLLGEGSRQGRSGGDRSARSYHRCLRQPFGG